MFLKCFSFVGDGNIIGCVSSDFFLVLATEAKIDSWSLSEHHDSSRPSVVTSNNQTFPLSQQHLQQSAVVGGALLPLPVAVVHLVPAAGQEQLTGAVQGGRVQRLAVDQTDQVLPVVLPAEHNHIRGVQRT